MFFFGGWLSPFDGYPVPAFLAAPGLHWLAMKIAFFLFCFLWFRATFPRYRYDQIMRLGWNVFIPVTLVWIVTPNHLALEMWSGHEPVEQRGGAGQPGWMLHTVARCRPPDGAHGDLGPAHVDPEH